MLLWNKKSFSVNCLRKNHSWIFFYVCVSKIRKPNCPVICPSCFFFLCIGYLREQFCWRVHFLSAGIFQARVAQSILHIDVDSFIELVRVYFPSEIQNSLADAVFFPQRVQCVMTFVPGKVHRTSYDSLLFFSPPLLSQEDFLTACFASVWMCTLVMLNCLGCSKCVHVASKHATFVHV